MANVMENNDSNLSIVTSIVTRLLQTIGLFTLSLYGILGLIFGNTRLLIEEGKRLCPP